MRDDVAAMVAKRDQLDREQEEQRRLEESAFERYARAQERIAEAEQNRAVVLAELDRRREEVVADAERELAAIGAEQCAVLAELHGRQRSAEDLAAMFGLPVKRVRTMLRRTRDGSPDGSDGRAQVGGRGVDSGVDSGGSSGDGGGDGGGESGVHSPTGARPGAEPGGGVSAVGPSLSVGAPPAGQG